MEMPRAMTPFKHELPGQTISGPEHDQEKWKPVFPAEQTQRVCLEVMLKQKTLN
jgi:hypothetical protein